MKPLFPQTLVPFNITRIGKFSSDYRNVNLVWWEVSAVVSYHAADMRRAKYSSIPTQCRAKTDLVGFELKVCCYKLVRKVDCPLTAAQNGELKLNNAVISKQMEQENIVRKPAVIFTMPSEASELYSAFGHLVD
ncbi:jg5718 [Pararge aegeria aegeria]|uniref:Jg5718 protein n=1 Tax=Pararge aegeria aegeria TaxID=348720 RepID=A0A8S4SAL0_9NEOP|nr:jg5718 [Pararge aegeria aegeria]